MEGIVFKFLFILTCVCSLLLVRLIFSFKLLLTHWAFIFFRFQQFRLLFVRLHYACVHTIFTILFRFLLFFSDSLGSFRFRFKLWLLICELGENSMRTKITSASLFFEQNWNGGYSLESTRFVRGSAPSQLSFLKLFKNPNVVTID